MALIIDRNRPIIARFLGIVPFAPFDFFTAELDISNPTIDTGKPRIGKIQRITERIPIINGAGKA
jgi:hypothetical protein